MTAYHNLPERNAKNRILDLLLVDKESSPMVTLPQSDLPISFYPKVPANASTFFYLLGGQETVDYVLCDESKQELNDYDGTLIALDPNDTEVWNDLLSYHIYPPSANQEIVIPASGDTTAYQTFADTWRYVVKFETPDLGKDCHFYVKISNQIVSSPNNYSVARYLNYPIPFEVGIETTLTLNFLSEHAPANAALIDDDTNILIDYGVSDLQGLEIYVDKPQAHITYQLQERSPNRGTILSDAVTTDDNQSYINLIVNTEAFNDDSVLEVRAFRNTTDEDGEAIVDAAILDQALSISFRPDTGRSISLGEDKNILVFGASATIFVEDYEPDVVYQLYVGKLSLHKYIAPTTIDTVAMQFTPVSLLVDADVQHIYPLDLVNVEGTDAGAQGLQFITEAMYDDSVFVVKATKSGEEFLLQSTVMVLVEPDIVTPDASIDTDNDIITITGTREGVKYQLQSQGASLVNIGNPGYHYTDRGIALIANNLTEYGTRIGIDFKVGGEGVYHSSLYNHDVILPTGTLTDGETLTILAIKPHTGLSVKLENYQVEI